MDSHHRFSKIQMVDGVSSFSLFEGLFVLENKKKVFYKPIAFSYAINSFFFISGFSPKRSTVLVPLDCTSLSYYRSQASRLHFAELLSFIFREEALRIAFFFACLYYSTRNFFCKQKYKKILFSKNEKVNSTHLSPSRFYFCTVDIFSFTFIMVCLNSF